MWGRRDRETPPLVPAMPTPPWLVDDSENRCEIRSADDHPDVDLSPNDLDEPAEEEDHEVHDGPNETAGHNPDGAAHPIEAASVANAGHPPNAPVSNDAGAAIEEWRAAQLAACWTVDCLSCDTADPDGPRRRAEALAWYQGPALAAGLSASTNPTTADTRVDNDVPAEAGWRLVELVVPGRVWSDAADPGVTWVDVHAVVTTYQHRVDRTDQAVTTTDGSAGGGGSTPADGRVDASPMFAPGASHESGGWSRRITSLSGLASSAAGSADREWWAAAVPVRRVDTDRLVIDSSLAPSAPPLAGSQTSGSWEDRDYEPIPLVRGA